jgi:flagellar hook assembly protein FlgD
VYITVTDLNGKVVTYFEGDGQEGVNALEWKGTSESGVPLQSGVYFVKLETDAGIAIQKVMLQR